MSLGLSHKKGINVSNSLFSVEEARQLARKRLPRMMFDFVDGASGDESLSDLNSRALDEIRLMPRVLVDVADRDLSSNILEQETGLPFGIAPMGMCALSWPGADQHMAREAAARRIPLCVSTASSSTLEQIIEDAEGHAWFQLYADQSGDFVDELIERAKASGYKVLILTVDVPIPSVRTRDLRNGFTFPMQWGPRQIWDFATHPRWSLTTVLQCFVAGMPRPMNYVTSTQGTKFIRSASRGRANWHFLEMLRDRWSGKLVVKGVQSHQDAIRIKAMGADAIYVSNHGGRQLNAAPTTIESLKVIRQAVGADMPLIFDGGIRSGEHVIKALASGANFAMVGRSAMYGLGAGGGSGLADILDVISNEASSVMGLIGHKSVVDVGSANLASTHNAEASGRR
ncbi:MAG: alpha-hydroxy-acid oxidizing protein [Candidatus Puniceispirillum sp.]|nr:alpha-hydroxy-acid oxidizing protein [Candidatus Puniceispirillum sp.]MBT6415301.1 alpha-hydroxy-acid oxidizing protein [Candidatus Puniceispirillum sp.]MBT6565418.1 alpha-hydroxy-acid oxidizing protein [Candidatus Puniceispirillum sp.]